MACVIDGMALVQRLKGDQKTFAAVAETLLDRVLNEGGSSDRIDVVFDDYREESIKNAERENRGEGSGNTGIFKPITRLNSGENSCVAQRTNKHS